MQSHVQDSQGTQMLINYNTDSIANALDLIYVDRVQSEYQHL